MTVPLICLLIFAGWTCVLVLGVGAWRSALVLRGKVPANGFASGEKHGADRYWRLNRAHMNAVETLPVVAAVIGTAAVIGFQHAWIDPLAILLVAARLVQTLIHVASGGPIAVQLRFAAFLTQQICLLTMIALMLF